MATEFVARGADLELVGIRKEFPGFTAIEDLDLKIPAGEFFALLGPSGCGKTTTLRLVAGLDEPTKGKILIGGKDVTATRAHERPVNTVFQSYALFPHMTVLENVAFGLRQRKIEDPIAKAQASLDLVELGHLG
ncbi:MAG: ATP-binding cassette domain-containing protein, partial [Actinobacteria bacterium]|nr:ATP-binding cassette domain-containing protein [Actinomycetota bacterium]